MKASKILVIFILMACSVIGSNAQNPNTKRVAIKVGADLGLTKGMSTSSLLDFQTDKTSTKSFGLDFGYKFWAKKSMSFDVNIGVGYKMIDNKLGIENVDYSYEASPDADVDHNSYDRYNAVAEINQTIDTRSLAVPIYLSYNIRCAKWLSFHLDAGAQINYIMSSTITNSTAEIDTYGVFSEYDDLMIDADWLDNFGHRSVNTVSNSEAAVNNLNCSLLLGGGFEIRLAKPLWLDLGVRYNEGFSNLFQNQYSRNSIYSSENAPITYTVEDGEVVKPLTRYLTKSKLSGLSLRAALVFRF